MRLNKFPGFRYERSLNEEAESELEVTFRERARDCVMDWRDRIYDRAPFDDSHYLVFAPFDPKVHESARAVMLTPSPTPAGSGPASQQSLHPDEHYVVRISG